MRASAARSTSVTMSVAEDLVDTRPIPRARWRTASWAVSAAIRSASRTRSMGSGRTVGTLRAGPAADRYPPARADRRHRARDRAGRLRPPRRSRGRRAAAAWPAGSTRARGPTWSSSTGARRARPSADADPDALAAARAAEVAEAAAVLGLASFELLGYPDGETENDLDLRGRLVEVVRRLRPDAVVCPDPTALYFGAGYVNHRDHRVVRVRRARRGGAGGRQPALLPRRSGRPTRSARSTCRARCEPDTAVDIGAVLERKSQALACHRSQVGEEREWVAELVAQRSADAGRVPRPAPRRGVPGAAPGAEVERRRRRRLAAVAELAPLAHGPQPEHRDDGGAGGAGDRADVAHRWPRPRRCRPTSAGRRSPPDQPPASPPSRMATKATARATGDGRADRASRCWGGRRGRRHRRPC